MLAMILRKQAPIKSAPLEMAEVHVPEPGPGELRLHVQACGICHTDLHVVEGELPAQKLPLIPGHQIVGTVDKVGPGIDGVSQGARMGVPWLHSACGTCAFCRRGEENLCENARFTGYSVDGGYAQYTVAPAAFAYTLPDGLDDVSLAPLLCAGIIGYRALRLSEIHPGGRLGLYGFGASAHIAIQIARHWGCEVFVFSRGEEHRRLAEQLGAAWTGQAADEPPALLDASIIFAPAGRLVPEALRVLRPGGTLALAGIYMTPIPEMAYSLLYGERTVRSVANSTRQDAVELLRLAAEIPIHTEVEVFPLREANQALQLLKAGKVKGAGVLRIC